MNLSVDLYGCGEPAEEIRPPESCRKTAGPERGSRRARDRRGLPAGYPATRQTLRQNAIPYGFVPAGT